MVIGISLRSTGEGRQAQCEQDRYPRHKLAGFFNFNRWLSRMAVVSVFFAIIGGFMCRLTKLLLKAVLVLFCGKSSIFQFIHALLSMWEFSTHQSLNRPPFVAVPSFSFC